MEKVRAYIESLSSAAIERWIARLENARSSNIYKFKAESTILMMLCEELQLRDVYRV